MPQFKVTMNVVEAKKASFIVDADNEDTVWDVIGEIDNWEDKLEWVTSEYEPPIIDNITQVKGRKVNKDVQKLFDCVIKDWETNETN